MKAFVTGASGFLGRFLLEALHRRGMEVTAPSSHVCNLTVAGALDAFAHTRYDVIYHLAAWTQAGDFCLHHPGEQWLINQKINTHLLDFWVQHQRQARLVAIGTSCSYDPTLELCEENYLLGKPIESLFCYAMTKRMLLTGLQALSAQYNLSYLYVIPSTLYGPSYHEDGRQMHFIFDLIRKILRGSLFNEPVSLWGDGEQRREIVHVEDFVSTLLTLLDNNVSNTHLNIGAGTEHSIKDYARAICTHINYPFDTITFDTTKYVGARSKVLSTHNLLHTLPTYSPRPLHTGLPDTISWVRSHAL